MTESYRMAGKTIQITSIYPEVHALCRDYRWDAPPDMTVEIQQSHIDYERERSAAEDRIEGIPLRQFSDSYLETLAVYRQIAEQMLWWNTILFHGSVVAVDGVGYLFTAKSGTGKSTHTRLWREHFGKRAVMVNDDKPLLQITPSVVTAFGTPWDGKHRLSSNISVPLKAICILERGEVNHIVPVTKAAAYPMLLQQSYRPQNPGHMAKLLELLDGLGEGVSLYRISCNMHPSAAQTAYDGLKG